MKKYYLPVVLGFMLTGCSDQDTAGTQTEKSASESQPIPRVVDADKVKRGRELYLKNCTVCHGINAEGAPDWRQRDAQGKFPAPPLNGTGHAWHHPMSALIDTIKNGTQRLGGNMPPWKDRLTGQEIEMIIYWFQSKWPDELYQAWQRMDREAQRQ